MTVEGQDCPVCGSHLFDDDDVVFCPVCGAPHHRDCYKSVGHCALEEFHGTNKEYQRPKPESEESIPNGETEGAARVCTNCGHQLSENSLFCPQCGHSTAEEAQHNATPPFQGFVIDPLGGVGAEEKIEDVPAGDVAKYVAVNPQRYLPVFKKLSKKHRRNWNWAAFLFPGGWLWYRKCYKQGFIFLAIAILCSVLNFPTQLVMNSLPLPSDGMVTYQQMMQMVYENLDAFMGLPWIASTIGMLLNLGQRIICGMFGDYMYRSSALEKIRTLREHENYPAVLTAVGGVNVFGLLLAFLMLDFIPTMLLMFL